VLLSPVELSVGTAPALAGACQLTCDSPVQVPGTPSMTGRTRHQRLPYAMLRVRSSLNVGTSEVPLVEVEIFSAVPA
jgi:hypothetical protein